MHFAHVLEIVIYVVLVGGMFGYMIYNFWRHRRIAEKSQEEWDDIHRLAASSDPEIKARAVKLFQDKMRRGPPGI